MVETLLRKHLTLFSALLLVALMSAAASPASAQQGWISNVVIKDFATGLEISASQPLVAGSTYNITFTIVVPYTANIMLSATTELERVGPQYWYVIEDAAGMINYSIWNPSENELRFSAKQGVLTVMLMGKVPSDACVISYPQLDLVLHKKRDITVVKLSIVEGSVIDWIKHMVVDSEILSFEEALSQKKQVLESVKDVAVEEYYTLANSIVSLAESFAEKGDIQLANTLLELVPSSSEEVPLKPIKPLHEVAMPYIAVALAAAFVGMVYLWRRSGFQLDYVKSITREQVRNLEALLVRASRVDRALASELEAVKKRLEEVE